MKKLGSLEGILKMLPGMGGLKEKLGELKVPDKELGRVEAMINSMTMEERKNPSLINPSRKERIARGSGIQLDEVNKLVLNFEQMRKMMKQMMGGKKKGGMPKMPKMPGLGGGMPGMPPGMEGMPGMPGMDAEEAARAQFTKAKAKRKKRVKPVKTKKKKK